MQWSRGHMGQTCGFNLNEVLPEHVGDYRSTLENGNEATEYVARLKLVTKILQDGIPADIGHPSMHHETTPPDIKASNSVRALQKRTEPKDGSSWVTRLCFGSIRSEGLRLLTGNVFRICVVEHVSGAVEILATINGFAEKVRYLQTWV